MQLTIRGNKVELILTANDGKKYHVSGTTDKFLGNIVTMLENEFPEALSNDSSFWVEDFLAGIGEGDSKQKRIWGLKENGLSLYHFNEFADGRKEFCPTLEDVERLRISHNITIAPLALPSMPGAEEGLVFNQLGRVFHVIYALLYFHALNKHTLKQCQLCGQWFAVPKKEAQTQFCKRKFSFTDWQGKTHEYQSCGAAREKISARLAARYRTIYQRLYARCGFVPGGKLQGFSIKAGELQDKVKNKPSADNLKEYEHFLFIDCEKLYPRYGREK